MSKIRKQVQLAIFKDDNAPIIAPSPADLETANAITQKILRFLKVQGHYCSRLQSQGQWREDLGIWTPSTVRRGIGDILAVCHGKTVMIEVKAGRDQLSEWQIKTQKDVEASGGLYLVARSFRDFLKLYKSIIPGEAEQ